MREGAWSTAGRTATPTTGSAFTSTTSKVRPPVDDSVTSVGRSAPAIPWIDTLSPGCTSIAGMISAFSWSTTGLLAASLVMTWMLLLVGPL